MIDLRSDTLTRPTEAMRAAMANAEVGDDVYAEDPTVNALEDRVSEMFGHEAALFTPTGSLANVLAVRSLVGVGQEVLCESSAHIARAELGAHGAVTGLTMRTWSHPRGQVDLAAIERLYAPDMGPFFVATAAVSVECTHNFAGGAVLPVEDLRSLRAWADGVDTRIHMDGARIWNAHVATGTPFAGYGAVAIMRPCPLSTQRVHRPPSSGTMSQWVHEHRFPNSVALSHALAALICPRNVAPVVKRAARGRSPWP